MAAHLLPGELAARGPRVIGATGGSGTRAVAAIVRRAGMFTGADLNESEDAVPFGDYSDRWINLFLAHKANGLPPDVEQEMRQELATLLSDHCAHLSREPRWWGWKEPRSIFLLPFFHQQLPALRFLHVVRDGRDMALSSNQNQLRKHGDAFLGPSSSPAPPTAERSMALWSRLNLQAASYGEERLGPRYYRIRFEDLCSTPATVIAAILDFLELEGEPDELAEEVKPPASLGRWRNYDPASMAAITRSGAEGLRRFGYSTGDEPRAE